MQEVRPNQAANRVAQGFAGVLWPAAKHRLFAFPVRKKIQQRRSFDRSRDFLVGQVVFKIKLFALPVGNQERGTPQKRAARAVLTLISFRCTLHPGAPGAVPCAAAFSEVRGLSCWSRYKLPTSSQSCRRR